MKTFSQIRDLSEKSLSTGTLDNYISKASKNIADKNFSHDPKSMRRREWIKKASKKTGE